MKRGYQRLKLGDAEELHLVEKEDHPSAMCPRRLTEGNEEVGKVLAEVAAVCEPLCGVKVQTRVQ